MMTRVSLVFCLVLILIAGSVNAHEIRPAYLQITQTSEYQYSVQWKIPRLGDMALRIHPEFESGFKLTQHALEKPVAGAYLYHFLLEGSRPLMGSKITVTNLDKTMVDVLIKIDYQDGEQVTCLMQPDNPMVIVPEKTTGWSVIKSYTLLGIEHIWFGIDHLLFVLALIILTTGFKKIIGTITAFTVAHSITLSMAVLDLARLPGPPVEAVIALSIIFLAVEIIRKMEGKQTLTGRKPWLVAFTFGLLHGFGFAGALSDIGLPQTEIPLALGFFNVGVELGQIAFILVALVIIHILSLYQGWSLSLRKIPPYLIGSIASFWVIDRVAAFF